MKRKTYQSRRKSKMELAKIFVRESRDNDLTLPELKEMKEFLESPEEIIEKDVKEVAEVAVTIYEEGLSSTTPVVEVFAQKELGMTPQEFGEVMEKSSSGDEVRIHILEEMEVPKKMIEEAKANISSSRKR